jgi:ribosomal protein S18 acetylase RimI-like enzyme
MTEGTFDLYWICVDQSLKKSGIGRALVRKMEEDLRASHARLVRVETEGTPGYEATRAFYAALGYEVLATIRDFYAKGRDLVIFGSYLE